MKLSRISRKKAAHAILAWTLSLALAAPAVSMTVFAATESTTQQQTSDTQNQRPPQPPQGAPSGQPPMGPPPEGSTPPGPPPDGSTPPGPPPDGQMGQPPQGGPQQGKSASELTATKIVDGETATLSGETYEATETDANAVLVRNNGTLALSQATLAKTGDSSSADASNFTGQNAIFLTADSTATLSDLTLTSDADGANAVFATGETAKVTAKHLKIHTKNNSSRGLDATYGGTIEAEDVDITTEGEHCAALATDRGEGTVTVHDGTFATSGQGSPNVYSTGAISVYDSTGKAMASEIAVVEGKNSIVLDGVDLTGSKDHGVMLYQSFSGDAGVGEASFSAKDSTLRNLSDGPMFFVTNTKAKASLTSVELQQAGSVLVNVAASRWGTTGANGGDFTLSAREQVLTGDVKADALSSITLQLGDAADYEGAFNADNTAKNAAITLTSAAKWTLTSDAYVTTIADAAKDFENIASNGHNIYYDASAATALGGKTYDLPGGGKLLPKA
ncbi:MAG: proline-rich domain-containing protein [Selenomonadaceae bacterium]|nr:proline-rich domain-containing protein [Selenomonadaceae bacterium]